MVIAFASLSVFHSQRESERAQLEADLSMVRSKLISLDTATLTHQQEILEEDLNQAYRGYQADKEKFVENIAVSNVIYSTANVNNVKITDMSSSDDSSEVIEGIPCIALSLQATVMGDFDNLVAFITQLNDDLINAVVKSVNMTIPISGNDNTTSMDIQIVIYTYEER
jgi:hypothetical protein